MGRGGGKRTLCFPRSLRMSLSRYPGLFSDSTKSSVNRSSSRSANWSISSRPRPGCAQPLEDCRVGRSHGEGLVATRDQPGGVDRALSYGWVRQRDVDERVYLVPGPTGPGSDDDMPRLQKAHLAVDSRICCEVAER